MTRVSALPQFRHATTEELAALRAQPQRRAMVMQIDAKALQAARAAEDPRLPISLSSEEPYERWFGFEILGHKPEEIDLGRAAEGLAFLIEHDPDDQIGLLEDVRIEDGCLRAMVRFGSHPDATWVKADMEAGIRKNISVGYLVHEMRFESEVEGVDTYRVTRWTPLEGSSVAIPADPTVGVGRSADPAARTDSPSRVPQPSRLDGAQERSMKDTDKATGDATGATAAEQTRSAEILTLCSEHELPIARALEFVKSGATKAQVAETILAELRANAKKPGAVTVTGMHDRAEDKPFNSLGDFLMGVVGNTKAIKTGRAMDPRFARAIQGMSENAPMDGGFAVPPEFASEILKNAWENGNILSRVRRIPMQSNSLKINVIKEDSRAKGSRYGGVQVAYVGEGGTGTAQKPKLRQIELNLGKLLGTWYLTDELLEDAPALQAEAQNAFTAETQFVMEDAIINGVGAGTPLGIMNSGAMVKVAIEATQTIANSSTFIAKNLAKMYAAMPAALLPDAIWLINQEFYPTLITATLGGTAAAQPVFLPPGLMSQSPYGAILGRPVFPVEYCAAPGTPGDILFVNLSQYLFGERGGIKVAQSMHVEFLSDQMCFRITSRNDGQPIWNTSLTPYKGSQALSPYVALDTRS